MKLTKIALIGLMSMSSLVAEYMPFGIKFEDTLDNYKVIRTFGSFGEIDGAEIEAPTPNPFFSKYIVSIRPRSGKIYQISADRYTTSVEQCKEEATTLIKELEKAIGPMNETDNPWDRPYKYHKAWEADGKTYTIDVTCYVRSKTVDVTFLLW